MKFRPRWARPANREFARLDAKWQARVLVAVDEICADPDTASNVKALNYELAGILRRRVGDLRIFFSVDRTKREVEIMTIRWRGSAY